MSEQTTKPYPKNWRADHYHLTTEERIEISLRDGYITEEDAAESRRMETVHAYHKQRRNHGAGDA